MSHDAREPWPIDLNSSHPRASNRTTPSQNRHINSLPPEIIFLIFRHYCGAEYGPGSLLGVCRLWHEIASDYGCLWAFIQYYPRSLGRENLTKLPLDPIRCVSSESMETAMKRAGNAKLALEFNADGSFRRASDNELLCFARALRMCQFLHIGFEIQNGFENAIVVEMPHLEELTLGYFGLTDPTPFLESVSSSAPHLRSLACDSIHVEILLNIPHLLERLIYLDVWSPPVEFCDQFFLRLNNLEHLRLCGILTVPGASLARLLSLHWTWPETPNQQTISLPALGALTIDGDTSVVSFISAPELKNLAIIKECWGTDVICRLLTATVRPTSFFIHVSEYDPDEFLRLLATWSGLLELHLKGDTPPGTEFAEALSGSPGSNPVCPSLRYLTVHRTIAHAEELNQASINRTIHMLRRIVNERLCRRNDSLQRVMYVWDTIVDPQKNEYPPRFELEWVDILDKSRVYSISTDGLAVFHDTDST